MCILPSFFKIGPKLITMSMEDRYFACTILGFPEASDDEESACSAGDMRHGFDPWVGKILRRRAWQPTPIFLSGESHGQRNLAGCSP